MYTLLLVSASLALGLFLGGYFAYRLFCHEMCWSELTEKDLPEINDEKNYDEFFLVGPFSMIRLEILPTYLANSFKRTLLTIILIVVFGLIRIFQEYNYNRFYGQLD